MKLKSHLPPLYKSFLTRQDIGSGNLVIAQGKSVLRHKFDFDVYLPSKGMNLQRPLVWSIEQKRSLIESIIIRRSIPPISVVLTVDDVYQVIDGKQRLSALIEFIQGRFDFCGYFCDDLPSDYLGQIKQHFITAYQLCEDSTLKVSDDDKIEWFQWINFAGTQQDMAHMARLSKG